MGSVTKLVTLILLSAVRKHAESIRIRLGVESIVELEIAGERYEEMRPSAILHEPILAKLAEMASAPMPPAGCESHGYIHLMAGSASHHYFELRIGHDEAGPICVVNLITEADMPR